MHLHVDGCDMKVSEQKMALNWENGIKWVELVPRRERESLNEGEQRNGEKKKERE